MRREPTTPRNETWADIKQYAWALVLVYPFIGVTAYFARGLLGARGAFWFGLGLSAFATLVFALVLVFSLAASYAGDSVGWFNRRPRPREHEGSPD